MTQPAQPADEVERKLSAARTRLIIDKPFLGALVLRLPLVQANPKWCRTTATDARAFYYNRGYIDTLSLAQTQFVLAHEALHCALSHFHRRQHRVKHRWDVACVKGDTIIPGDYERIAALEIGSSVFGASGSTVRVTNTFKNEFSGDMVRIKAAYLAPLELTPEHPLLAVPFQMKAFNGLGTSKKRLGAPEWINAKDITRFHMLVIPKLKGTVSLRNLDLSRYVNRATIVNGHDQAHRIRVRSLALDEHSAWVMGVYVAEGSASGKQGIKFSLGKARDAELARRLVAFFRDRIGLSPQWQESPRHPTTVYISVASPILMRAFADWFGRGAAHKRIPDWLLQHESEAIVRSFLQGYMAEDGCIYQGAGRQGISLDTVSERLALQLQLLLARFAGLVTLQKKFQPRRTLGGAELPEGWIYKLQSRNRRVLEFLGVPSESTDRRTLAHDMGDYWLVRVRSTERSQYTGPVYNIETEDHSYLVSNAVVHNCDYAVNPLLVADGLQPPPGALLMDAYDGMTAEEIYPYIKENENEEPLDQHLYDDEDQPRESPKTSGRGQRGSCGGSSESDSDEPSPDDGGGGESPNTQGGGPQAQGETDPNAGGAPQPPPLSQSEREQLAVQWQQRLAGAAQQALQAGKLGGSMARLVDHLLQPQLPWRMLLARYMNAVARTDYSFGRPSRREGAAILPSLRSSHIDIAVMIDTSGSIEDDEMQEFLGEINAIKGALNARITLHACDAALSPDGPWTFEPWEELRLPKTFHGGGGTRFTPAFEWAEHLDQPPNLLLYFTDAEGEFPKHEPPFPVLWLVKGKAKVPWGQRVQLN